MTTSRTQFESWYQQRFGHSLYLEWNDQGFYESPATGNLFMAWEASRAAVVVELPQQSGANPDWNQAIRYCRQAIEAVGLKVKP